MKLMAIPSWAKERSKALRVVGADPCWSSRSPRVLPLPRKWIWGYRMTRWRRSTREGNIYRAKWVGANLTYLFAASVKSKGIQVDMVTVRTVIKGLRRWFDSKQSLFWRYFIVQDLLVGPSAVPSNGTIADGRIKRKDSVWEVEEFEGSAGESGQGCLDLTADYQIGRINCGKASLLQII